MRGWTVERRWPMLAGGAVLVVMAGAVVLRGMSAWVALTVGVAGGWMIGFGLAAVRR